MGNAESWASRRKAPWVVAFAFGLIHGLELGPARARLRHRRHRDVLGHSAHRRVLIAAFDEAPLEAHLRISRRSPR